MYTSVIVAVLGPGGIPQSFEVACAFDMNRWKTHLPALFLVDPQFLLVMKRQRGKTDRRIVRNVLLLSSSDSLAETSFSCRGAQPLKVESWFYNRDDVKWINLPRQDCILTTGILLSCWDPLQHVSQGFPIASANQETRYTLYSWDFISTTM